MKRKLWVVKTTSNRKKRLILHLYVYRCFMFLAFSFLLIYFSSEDFFIVTIIINIITTIIIIIK